MLFNISHYNTGGHPNFARPVHLARDVPYRFSRFSRKTVRYTKKAMIRYGHSVKFGRSTVSL